MIIQFSITAAQKEFFCLTDDMRLEFCLKMQLKFCCRKEQALNYSLIKNRSEPKILFVRRWLQQFGVGNKL